MTTTKSLTFPDSETVKQEGVQILIKHMGVAKAAIFIRSTLYQTEVLARGVIAVASYSNRGAG